MPQFEEEGQTLQWPNVQKDKQWSTKYYTDK